MLPAFFIGLSSVMILLGLAALWQSLRSVLAGGAAVGLDTGPGLPERAALQSEKRTLLRAIKDIQFEREMGKLSDEDFERLDKAYRARAKRVLALLDQDLEPYLVRAEREVTKAMGEEDPTAYRGGGRVRRRKRKAGKKRRRARTPEPMGIACPSCGALNDHDALHCKACGARVAPFDCPQCGTENDPDAKFCKSCAVNLQESPEDE